MRFVFVALLISTAAFAQRTSNWRMYRAADGMQESVCTALSVSPRGGIWVHHPDRSKLTWIDGYQVQKTSMPGLAASRIYEGRVGQIWSSYAGGVQEFKDGVWIHYPIKLLAGKSDTILLPLRQGQVLALSPDRLITFTCDPSPEAAIVRDANATKLGGFTDMVRSRDGGAWIAGKKGIGKFTSLRPLDASTPFEEQIPPAEFGLENFSALAEDDDGGITCIAITRDGKKAAAHWDGTEWSLLPAATAELIQAWRSIDGTYWELGPYALVRLHKEGNQWRTDDELLAAQYYQALPQTNGVFWLATSEGLYRYAPLIWQTADPNRLTGDLNIARGTDRRLWAASPSALHCFDGTEWRTFSFPTQLKSTSTPEVLIEIPNRLLVGNSTNLFAFDIRTSAFAPVRHPSGSGVKFIGAVKDAAPCFQIFSGNSTESIRLETFDGDQFRPFIILPANPSIGATVQSIFAAQNGTLWISSDRGSSAFADGKWESAELPGTAPDGIIVMLEMDQNRLWAATRDRIVQFNGKDWSAVRAGFDRISAMFKSRDGSVWVASNNGVHRFYKGEWVATGSEEGLISLAVRQVIEDSQGRIWAATARGLNLYHPEADTEPPDATIQQIPPETISSDGAVTVEFTGQDRWKQALPDRLLYSYRIDEQDWSPLQSERSVHFNELSGGKHFFQVRAMDRNWNVETKPALLEFFVPVPWFRETRLLLIGGAAGIAVLFFAGLAFNRHRQLVRSYAEVEKIVEQRTRELEKANRELFQSQKMNALGTLAAGIAHDFNSILSIIKGSAQIIETNVDNPEKIQTRTDRIKTAVDQGAGIVKAMLGFSRSSDHKVTQCDLNPLIEETIRLLGDRFQRDTEVKFEAVTGLPPVCVVPDFVQQIVLNFILNAAESMPVAGKIIVRTGVLNELPTEFALSPEPAAHYAYVAVQDFGTGIAPDVMPRIFEPFFTTKALSTKRGTGLGLSMVYELAKEMKCGLSVRSKVGEGSTFMLVVPIAT